MANPFLGELRLFAGNFAPLGWAFCNGQILPISQNTALFSLLGTTYGGNGQTSFALPDLRSRIPVHFGTARTGTAYIQGELAGSEQTTLTTDQIPAHTHVLQAATVSGDSADPTSRVWAESDALTYSTAAPNAAMSPAALSAAGSTTPHDNMTPYLAVNFIIALEGIFPSRN